MICTLARYGRCWKGSRRYPVGHRLRANLARRSLPPLDPCGHSLSISALRSNEAHERSQGMLNRIGYALAVAALASGLMGCQNKLAKERDELYVQNRELQAKNEAMQAAMESQ